MKRKPKCLMCGFDGTLDETVDAYRCNKCNMWLEPICNDKDCYYCSKRDQVQKQYTLQENLVSLAKDCEKL